MAKRPIMAFMSYSDEDEEMAAKFKKEFAKSGINVFVASEDIKAGSRWADILVKEIKKREFFIMLVTQNYHRGEYTDQECGMAMAWGRTVIPIIIDDALAEGFIDDYQYKKCKCCKIKACVKKIRSEINPPEEVDMKTIDYIIKKMNESHKEDRIVFFARQLLQFESFTAGQINCLSKAYLENPHIAKGIAGLVISDVLNRNYGKVGARIKGRLGTRPKRLEKAYEHRLARADKFAVSQDFWKKIEIEVHKADCGYVPEYMSHESAKWFFAPTLANAREMARGLGKMYNTRVISCQHCRPGKKGPDRRRFWQYCPS